MWTGIILGFLAWFIIMLGLFVKEIRNDEGVWRIIGMSLFAGFVMWTIGNIFALVVPCKSYIKQTKYEVVALRDNSTVSGGFFLGCGTVNGKMQYVMYINKGDYYEMKTLSTSYTKIRYTKETPYLEILQRQKVEDSIFNKFVFIVNDMSEYIIYIPQGSILQNYTLDAK